MLFLRKHWRNQVWTEPGRKAVCFLRSVLDNLGFQARSSTDVSLKLRVLAWHGYICARPLPPERVWIHSLHVLGKWPSSHNLWHFRTRCFSFLLLKQSWNASIVTKVTKPEGIKLKEEHSLYWEEAGGIPSFLYFYRGRDAKFIIQESSIFRCTVFSGFV